MLLPGEVVESSLISEPGTSSGSGVETTVGRIERRENNPEESGSEREVVETFDWVDFRKYLPDTFDDLCKLRTSMLKICIEIDLTDLKVHL